MTPLDQAAAKLTAQLAFNPASNVHTVYESTKLVNGVDTGVPCVVAVVPKKLPGWQVANFHVPIPQSVHVEGNGEVCVDVQEGPVPYEGCPYRIQLLRADEWPQALYSGYSADQHQRCFSPTVPGGVQVAPNGASWVGTLGIGWYWEGKRFGFLTNRHVAGLDRQLGDRICQPHGQASPIGYLAHFEKLDSAPHAQNEFDVALYDCELQGKHFIKPEIFGIGSIKPDCVDFAVGDDAQKSGRTTGVTRGKCIGKNGATTVNYGPGRNLRMVGIDFFTAMSAPGDSGSALLKAGQFGALLFAGSEQHTLGIPAVSIQKRIGGEPFVIA